MKTPHTISASSQLDAALHFLKKHSKVTLKNLMNLGKIQDTNGVFKKIHASYFSNARKDEMEPEYRALLKLILDSFSLLIIQQEPKLYQVHIENQEVYQNGLKTVFQDMKTIPAFSKNGNGTETLHRKMKEFSSTWWSLYFWSNFGIGKAILYLGSNKDARIKNTPNIEGLVRDYEGLFSFDVNLMYLSLSMKDAQTGEKDLLIKMAVGRGGKPALCLGQYQNIGDRGGEIYSATCVFVLENKGTEKLSPELFHRDKKEQFERLSPSIRRYFQAK